MVLKTFPTPPLDEVKLTQDAESYVMRFQGEVPSTLELKKITDEVGLELATMVYYQALIRSREHGGFIEEMNRTSVLPSSSKTSRKLVIIPSWLYKEHPEWGGDGTFAGNIAQNCGLSPVIIPCSGRGTVRENAEIILKTLSDLNDEVVWLMAYSKGVLELRYAFQQFPDHPALKKIKHWITFSGNANGSKYIDMILEHRFRRAAAHALARVNSISFDGFSEMGSEHPYWKTPFQTPDGIEVTNILGVPLLGHVENISRRGYRRLSSLGPNDGSVLLGEAPLLPGKIYPVWGTDHFFRSPQTSQVLYRLFNLLLRKN